MTTQVGDGTPVSRPSRRPLSRGERMLLVIYPLMALDFGWLRERPWTRVGLVATMFVALQVVHLVYEPPGAQYGTWATGASSLPPALGRPNLLEAAVPALGVVSVAMSAVLPAAVLAALALLVQEARRTP